MGILVALYFFSDGLAEKGAEFFLGDVTSIETVVW